MTLDSDTEAIVRRRMRERGVSFKQAINDTIRDGAQAPRRASRPSRTQPHPMGLPIIDLDRALQAFAALEDEEIVRKMRLGK